MADYKIKLDAFEGPMDLLMHLIEKNKINIYDIPISQLTEQYLDYLNQFTEFNIEIASEFLVMAATLLQIKSRILLPKPPKETEDDEGIDPRQELVERILEYRKFKEISTVMEGLAEQQAQIFTRPPQQQNVKVLPLRNLDISLLVEAFSTLLAAKEEAGETVVEREEFSIHDKIADILQLVTENLMGIHFEDAFIRSGTRSEMIVTFLALLELIKLHKITITQHYPFAPIFIQLANMKDRENK